MILVLLETALNLSSARLNPPLPFDSYGTLSVSFPANASTTKEPTQELLASPTANESLYIFPTMVLTI